jgi:putative ABC transport system substrate-binding protein
MQAVRRRTACSAVVCLAQAAGRKARVGFLTEAPLDAIWQRAALEPFRRGLRELGYIEGQNLVLEIRSAEGKKEGLKPLMSELLRLDLDVLVTGFAAAALAAKEATRTLPVVAAAVDDPVATGLATTLARPGGNITGVSGWAGELVAKRLQLVRELVPGVRRVGILFNPDAVPQVQLEGGVANWESALGIPIRVYGARVRDEFEAAFTAMARDGVGGLVVLADANTYVNRVLLNELCLQRRMPSVWGGRDWLTGGGLASYQSDYPAIFRRAATLVDYVLKGQKPAEIPFEQATKLELVVDTRAARALGITVPQTLLLAANEVIE